MPAGKKGVRVGATRARPAEGAAVRRVGESRRAGRGADEEEGSSSDRESVDYWRRRLLRRVRRMLGSDSVATVRTVLACAMVLCTLLSVYTLTSLVRATVGLGFEQLV